jgi:hypothetical protein
LSTICQTSTEKPAHRRITFQSTGYRLRRDARRCSPGNVKMEHPRLSSPRY